MSRLFAILSALLLTFSYCYADELVLAVEFCRHGARAPIGYPFGKQMLKDFTVGEGNLTAGGMRMHGLLGEQLREELIEEEGLLPENYDVNTITVYADIKNRTIQSARSQMYGLYPLGTGLEIPNEEAIERALPPLDLTIPKSSIQNLGSDALAKKYAPIPVLFWPITEELRHCKAIKHNEPYFHLGLLLKALGKVEHYAFKMAKWTGESPLRYIFDPVAIGEGFDLVICNYYAGYDIPDFDHDDYEDAIQLLNYIVYMETSFTDYFARLHANPMVSSLQSLIDGKVSGSTSDKFVLFSGHDTDLAPLLAALEQPRYYPYFASAALFKLYKKEGTAEDSTNAQDFYVKAFFNDEELQFPSCKSNPCSAEEFSAFLSEVIVPDWEEVCGL